MNTVERRRCVVLIESRALYRDCLVQTLGPLIGIDLVAIPDVVSLDGLPENVAPAMIVFSVPEGSWHEKDPNDLDVLLGSNLGVPIAILTPSIMPAHAVAVMKKGAQGYILSNTTMEIATAAIRFVAVGGTYVPASVLLPSYLPTAGAHTHAVAPSFFTARQAAVVEGLRKGKANKVIAYELAMCESTVKVHVRKIMRKLKATNRTQVAYLLNENGASVCETGKSVC